MRKAAPPECNLKSIQLDDREGVTTTILRLASSGPLPWSAYRLGLCTLTSTQRSGPIGVPMILKLSDFRLFAVNRTRGEDAANRDDAH